jgi:hypothetical protein
MEDYQVTRAQLRKIYCPTNLFSARLSSLIQFIEFTVPAYQNFATDKVKFLTDYGKALFAIIKSIIRFVS